MRKSILILFTVAIASVNAMAQEPGKPREKKTPEERAENMTKRLTKELSLNQEQQLKTKEIILKRELEREKVTKEMREGQEKIKGELKQILTSEQFQKFEQKEKEMKKKREQRRKNGEQPPKKGPPAQAPEEK